MLIGLLIIKGLKNLAHHLVVEGNRFLQFGDTLHQLHKEHWLCVLFTFFGNENRVTHRDTRVLNSVVGLPRALTG